MLRALLLVAIVAIASSDPLPIPPFNCPRLPTPPAATDVRKLRFGNIKAVMAIGDSITAGFGMMGKFLSEFEEWREYVYSIGGNTNATTLFTLLQKVGDANVQGGAMGKTLPMTKGAWLDAGVSGARIRDWPGQVDFLVKQLQGPYKTLIDFNNDWKLLTAFLGANDLCAVCKR